MPLVFRSSTRTVFRWDPEDPANYSLHLIAMEDYFEHTQAFSEDAKDEAQVDMARRFEEEIDPTGTPWPPLKQPAPDQIGILRLSGDMAKAAIEDAWVATPTGLFFDVSVLPLSEDDGYPYWQEHETAGGRIPQRRFIGLSGDAQERLQNRFDEWVKGGITLGSRGFVRQLRAPAGVFRPLASS